MEILNNLNEFAESLKHLPDFSKFFLAMLVTVVPIGFLVSLGRSNKKKR